jgi:nuclear transport factor 2 (NTF2) superfamily protein
MRHREASINDVPTAESDRQFFEPAPGPRPADHLDIPDIEESGFFDPFHKTIWR